jgi:adenine deaminase
MKVYGQLVDIHTRDIYPAGISILIANLISEEYNAFDVIRSATINPSEHY